jgi:hypothetical protein
MAILILAAGCCDSPGPMKAPFVGPGLRAEPIARGEAVRWWKPTEVPSDSTADPVHPERWNPIPRLKEH